MSNDEEGKANQKTKPKIIHLNKSNESWGRWENISQLRQKEKKRWTFRNVSYEIENCDIRGKIITRLWWNQMNNPFWGGLARPKIMTDLRDFSRVKLFGF